MLLAVELWWGSRVVDHPHMTQRRGLLWKGLLMDLVSKPLVPLRVLSIKARRRRGILYM
jgi:hypothetical protein